MPGSSNNAVYNGDTNGPVQPHPSNGPANHNFAIGRFLSDPDQQSPLGLRAVQSAAEAEAAAKARMVAKLHAFEQQFSSNSEPKAK
ncbi:hypothetical protein BBK36DRAFT_1125924 [Trichoderma citrinoviride]|uniref:Uncharacterized protein n=1 Tax=Trichoderma citrinoviride TaxID=58853 RepID=A0A2T4B360_9HYPO|nr:hypothetical protein BBK36DRAFT_1125924 [Trichoderma citrinoviride]PTB63759.1 hypothetical protein BBK36DRAFT_1125924 [Trichoderma citrinoviride]